MSMMVGAAMHRKIPRHPAKKKRRPKSAAASPVSVPPRLAVAGLQGPEGPPDRLLRVPSHLHRSAVGADADRLAGRHVEVQLVARVHAQGTLRRRGTDAASVHATATGDDAVEAHRPRA